MDSGPIVICDKLYINKSIDYYPELFDSHDDDYHEPKDKSKTNHKKAMVPFSNEGYDNDIDYEDNHEPKDIPKTSHEKASARSIEEDLLDDVEHTVLFKFHSVGIFPPSTDDLDYPIDVIGQFDGNDSVASITEPTVLVRNHSFTLNREKQTNSLAHDTAIDDFEIIINNKDANINIKCNPGFYAGVARPAMISFMQGTKFSIGSVHVHCFHIAFNRDSTGVEESRVLHLDLGDGSAHPPQAKVTLTLHHTTRLLQIQGGTMMSDKSKAATWFLHHYVKQKFDFEAKLKKYDISKFNRAINELFTESQSFLFNQGHSCGHCLKNFTPKAIPVLCPLCLKQTHKSRCHPCPNLTAPLPAAPQHHLLSPLPINENLASHGPNGVSSKRLTTTPSRLIQTVSLQSSATIQSPSSTQRTSSQPPYSSATSITSSNTSSSAVQPSCSRSQPISSVTFTSSQAAPSTSSLNINAEPFSFTQKSKESKGKQVKKNGAEKSEVDFLRLQLNAAITRITQLDADVSDYEKKVQILMTRLGSYEERDNKVAYEQNFSNNMRAPASNPESRPPHPCPPPPPPKCTSSPTSPLSSCSHKSQQHSYPCVPEPTACNPWRLTTCPCCASPPRPVCCCSWRSTPASCLPRNTSANDKNCTNEQLSEVNNRLLKLVDDMVQVKQSIFNLQPSSPAVSHPSQETPATAVPTRGGNSDAKDVFKPPADTDESFVSIEEFIPDDELAGTPHHLNSNHPTIQHSLLKHPSPLLL